MRAFHALAVALFATLLVGLADARATTAGAACPDANDLPGSAAQLADTRAAVLCLVNKERTTRGLRALKRNALLQKVATSLSKDMVRRHFFDHTTPSGKGLGARLAAFRWRGSEAGENIAWGSGTLGSPAQIVEAWMRSPAHRANILLRSFRRGGVGVALGTPQDGAGGPAATYTMDYDRP